MSQLFSAYIRPPYFPYTQRGSCDDLFGFKQDSSRSSSSFFVSFQLVLGIACESCLRPLGLWAAMWPFSSRSPVLGTFCPILWPVEPWTSKECASFTLFLLPGLGSQLLCVFKNVFLLPVLLLMPGGCSFTPARPPLQGILQCPRVSVGVWRISDPLCVCVN